MYRSCHLFFLYTGDMSTAQTLQDGCLDRLWPP